MLLKEFRLLTREEEQEAFRKMREEGCQKSRELLVESQLRYATKLAMKHVNRVTRYPDKNLLDEVEAMAWMGVVRAVDCFDPSRGLRLTTLVLWTVRTDIGRRDLGGPIALPLNPSRNRKIPHLLELAQKAHNSVSLDRSQETPNSRTKDGRFATDPWMPLSTDNPEETVERAEEIEKGNELVRSVLTIITDPRHRYILHQRLTTDRTLDDIGSDLGITRERVRQIEMRALDKVRKAHGQPTSREAKKAGRPYAHHSQPRKPK